MDIDATAAVLAENMAFAKVVDTDRGEAMLIGGCVFHVTGPEGNCAELLVRAMRRSQAREGLSAGKVQPIASAQSVS